MLKQEQDLLYMCFERNLYNYDIEDECVEDFTSRVLEDFARTITKVGHIPTQYLADLHRELEEEIVEMLQKKIYGHYNIGEFRRQNESNSQ